MDSLRWFVLFFTLTTATIGCRPAESVSQTREAEPTGENLKWHESYAEAQAEAAQTGRPILANFTGSDWCGWCIRLEDEVFATPQFSDWAKQNVVLLKLDYPRKTRPSPEIREQNSRLAKQYEIRGYPTILFLDADGNIISQYGYDSGGPEPWIGNANQMLGKS